VFDPFNKSYACGSLASNFIKQGCHHNTHALTMLPMIAGGNLQVQKMQAAGGSRGQHSACARAE